MDTEINLQTDREGDVFVAGYRRGYQAGFRAAKEEIGRLLCENYMMQETLSGLTSRSENAFVLVD